MKVKMLKELLENIDNDYEVCCSDEAKIIGSLEIKMYEKKIVLK